jgi:predicted NAD/FAD-binding protein
MLVDIVRFQREARHLLARYDRASEYEASELDRLSLADLVEAGHYSRAFVDEHLVPLGAAIWSADPVTFTRFPAVTYARFMNNHGLLRLRRGPRWRTITGGSQRYVDALVAALRSPVRLGDPVSKVRRRGSGLGVEVVSAGAGLEVFDRVVLAGHSDQVLDLLADASDAERQILGALRYQPNTAVLHTDDRFLPSNPRARASWNYHVGSTATSRSGGTAAAVTYWLNRLQGIESSRPLLVTLNRDEEIAPASILGRFDFDHPVFDVPALDAQRRLADIQGVDGTYFAGAYWGYGFHEDGVRSAYEVCRGIGAAA